MAIIKWFKEHGISHGKNLEVLEKLRAVSLAACNIISLKTEVCFYIEYSSNKGNSKIYTGPKNTSL